MPSPPQWPSPLSMSWARHSFSDSEETCVLVLSFPLSGRVRKPVSLGFIFTLWMWKQMALKQQVISYRAVKKKKTVKIIKCFSHSNEMRLTDSCFLGHMSACHSLHLGLKHPTRLKDFVSSGKMGRVATYSPTSQGCCEDLRSIPLLLFLSQGQRKKSHDLCLWDLLYHLLIQHLYSRAFCVKASPNSQEPFRQKVALPGANSGPQ